MMLEIERGEKNLFTVLYKFECENLVSSDPNLTPTSSFITFPFFDNVTRL